MFPIEKDQNGWGLCNFKNTRYSFMRGVNGVELMLEITHNSQLPYKRGESVQHGYFTV